jgi:hypothetical protein
MNIPGVEAIKTHTVSGNWVYTNTPGDTFLANIDVEFIPDEIRLVHVSYYDKDTNTSDAVTLVKSSLIDGRTLFSFSGVTSFDQYYNIRYRNFKQIQGGFTFSLYGYTGAQILNIATVNSIVSMTFEFIKYREQKIGFPLKKLMM